MANVWQELAKAALLGLSRKGLPPSARAVLENQEIAGGLRPEEIFLSATAIARQRRRAGYSPSPVKKEALPPPDEAAPPRIGDRAGRLLGLILDGPYQPALEEFVALLIERGYCLPPESLPYIFEYSLRSPDAWSSLRAAVGSRGAWLARLHPVWKALLDEPDEADWKTGDRAQRLRLLRYWRARDLEKAPRVLRESWSKETYQDKLAFLKAIAEAPLAAEAEFLETCLDEGRKELRLCAASALRQLPASAFAARAFQRAACCVRPIGAKGLSVELPAEIDAAAARDGALAGPAPRGMNAKVFWLYQWIADTPPPAWERHFNDTPEGCIARFERDDVGKSLLPALVEATARYQAERWRPAWFHFWMRANGPSPRDKYAEAILRGLSQAEFEAAIRTSLKNKTTPFNERHVGARLLLLDAHRWPGDIAKKIVEALQDFLASAKDTFAWNAWHIKSLLHVAAYRCDTGLKAHFLKGWPTEGKTWQLLQTDIEYFLQVLHFRAAMIEALRADG